MPNPIQPSRRQTRIARCVGISFALWGMVAIASGAMANEKRVTVPIALPFQHASSAAASSAATQTVTAPTHNLSANPFSPSGSSVASQSTAAATSAAVERPVVSSKPVVKQVPTSQPDAKAPSATKEKPPSPTTAKAVSSKAANSKAAASKAAATPSAAKAAETQPALALNEYPVTVASPPSDITTAPISAPRYPQGNREAFVTEFEDYVAQKIAPFVPGVAVVIVSGGQIKSLQTYGVKKAGGRDKVTPDTVFRLASVSKTIASTASAIMVKDGQLEWDTKVTSQLPGVKFKNAKYGNQITLRHLLSQSAGLPTHTYSHFIDANMAYAETVRRLQYVNFVCPPGKCYAYQNVVYSLAGEMIKKKAGMSYENYVEQKLFEPLGMRSASFGLANYNASPNRATPHTASGKRWLAANVTDNWYHVPPAAGANASIADMSRFLLAQLGNRQDVLPTATLNQLQARVTKNTPAQNHYGTRKGVGNTAYGLGWRVFDYGRHKNFVHHGGWVKGFRSEVVFNRDLQIGMVFLTNSETRLARDVIFKFMDMHERAYQAAQEAAKKK